MSCFNAFYLDYVAIASYITPSIAYDLPSYRIYFCVSLVVYIANCTNGCHNGGTCILPEVCTCTPGWTGINCESGEV